MEAADAQEVEVKQAAVEEPEVEEAEVMEAGYHHCHFPLGRHVQA